MKIENSLMNKNEVVISYIFGFFLYLVDFLYFFLQIMVFFKQIYMKVVMFLVMISQLFLNFMLGQIMELKYRVINIFIGFGQVFFVIKSKQIYFFFIDDFNMVFSNFEGGQWLFRKLYYVFKSIIFVKKRSVSCM